MGHEVEKNALAQGHEIIVTIDNEQEWNERIELLKKADVAIDPESVVIKKLVSPVAGDADCLLFPNIESANVFWKTNSKLANAVRQAGMLVGTTAPCVLASRADTVDTKLNSIAEAVMFVK